jgi:hypothetical protein
LPAAIVLDSARGGIQFIETMGGSQHETLKNLESGRF